jgi:hypothetical protein
VKLHARMCQEIARNEEERQFRSARRAKFHLTPLYEEKREIVEESRL